MLRFRCPECGRITEVAPAYGDEVVSVYCLNHRGGADAHTRPVYMALIPAEVALAEREPALAAAA